MKKYLILVVMLVLLALHFVSAYPQANGGKDAGENATPKATPSPNPKETDNSRSKTENDNKAKVISTVEDESKQPDKGGRRKEKPANAAGQRNAEPPDSNSPRPSFDETEGSNSAIIRAGRLDEENKKLRQQLQENENTPPLTQDSLGPLGWFTSPLLFWMTALLFIAALALHAVHFIKDMHTSRVISQLWASQQRSANASRAAGTGKSGAVESLTQQVREQGQGLNQFSTQLTQLQDRLAERDKQLADAVQAVALTASWVGHAQLREAAAADGSQIGETERASAIALLERYEEPLRANAGRVEPLAQAMAALVEKLEAQPQLPPELISRAQSLHQGIGQFDLWQTNVKEQLAALRRGSFTGRSAMLQSDQQRLIEQVSAGGISIAQMVQKSRELLDHHFPRNTQKSLTRLPTAEDEIELKKRIEGAPEFLMDWFDSFSQFQSQMVNGQALRVPPDPDIMGRLAQIQALAREALSKFDIQPEEIQVGRTGYDRRLHEATLVRQSSQFPINTVIEVLRCGFRRMSTGEVLRRPQVVVAGAVAG